MQNINQVVPMKKMGSSSRGSCFSVIVLSILSSSVALVILFAHYGHFSWVQSLKLSLLSNIADVRSVLFILEVFGILIVILHGIFIERIVARTAAMSPEGDHLSKEYEGRQLAS